MMTSKEKPVPAVVLGLSPTGLYAVRELGAADIPVLGVSSYKQAGNYSRYLKTGLGSIVESDGIFKRWFQPIVPGEVDGDRGTFFRRDDGRLPHVKMFLLMLFVDEIFDRFEVVRNH